MVAPVSINTSGQAQGDNNSTLGTVVDILSMLSGNKMAASTLKGEISDRAKATVDANAQSTNAKGLKDVLLESGGSMTLGDLRKKYPHLVDDAVQRLYGEKSRKMEGSESASGDVYDYYGVKFHVDEFDGSSMDSDHTVISLQRRHHEVSSSASGPGSAATVKYEDYGLDS